MKLTTNTPTLLQSGILAQADFPILQEKGIPVLMGFALLLCVGGLIYAGYSIMRGNIEVGIAAVIGSLFCGGAGYISSKIFEIFSSL